MKPNLSGLPQRALAEVARVLDDGEAQFGRDTWREGRPWTDHSSALLRHTARWLEGEEVDVNSGLHPLAHVAARALMLLQLILTEQGTDDRPKINTGGKL